MHAMRSLLVCSPESSANDVFQGAYNLTYRLLKGREHNPAMLSAEAAGLETVH